MRLKTIELDGVKYVKESEVKKQYKNMDANSPFEVGEKYLIRTVTHITVGRIVSVGEKELVLEDASWIADTGRFHNALKDGSLDEVEPWTSNVILGRGAIVDASTWKHDLPKEQK